MKNTNSNKKDRNNNHDNKNKQMNKKTNTHNNAGRIHIIIRITRIIRRIEQTQKKIIIRHTHNEAE